MQVKETVSDGLKHEFQVSVPAADLDARANARLNDLKTRVRINGFRPGKVPLAHLKKVYGRSVMAETIEEVVRETNNQIFSERGFKLANEPKVTLPTEEKAVEDLLAGNTDLAYSVAIEVIPPIALADFKAFKIEKLVAEVGDKEIDDQVAKIAEQNRPFAAKGEGAKAEQGDRVTISFTGKIDGTPFEVGKGENIPVPIGSNTFIPGFEDQLVGMAAGDSRVVKVTFPVNYGNDTLAGKDAEFETTASLVETPQAVAVDDEFAKTLGLESLDKLKEAVRDRIRREFDTVARQRLKRSLLDLLDEAHKFDPPQSLVDEEFNAMWTSITSDMASAGRSFADDKTTEDDAKADYRKIADRRVRLGLVLAEIGEKNKISVTDEEVSRALIERARQFPGQEKQVWDYYRNNPQALAQLRAPIYEDKVVDFIVELAAVTEKTVSREELYKDEGAENAAA
ncbi:MAG: trigger factor [Xanthobacteraceae bacterium]|nr:MAG: trigger factor [Xanthobacteraceae bacterium]